MSKQRIWLYNVDVKSEVEAKLKIICWRSTKLWMALKRAQEESFDTLTFKNPLMPTNDSVIDMVVHSCSLSYLYPQVPNIIHFMYFKLGRGQTSNFSWDEPNLVSQVHEKIDVWLSWVRLNEFGGVQHFLSVCFTRIERLKIVSWTNFELHMRRTKLMN